MSSRILVVEDTPANIQALSTILQGHGYQVSVATNGKQALEVLERIRPDLILLDIMMPEMDGFETCTRIKASTTWREIPLIFLTARADTADIVRGFEMGAVDYVAKPFNAHELLARVNTHLTIDNLHRENQRLLLNVLPAAIAEKLKQQVGIIAERFDDVSVLFSDLVGFTPLSLRMSPTDLVELLNRVFSGFDELADRYGVEKIKTIGDAYMAAGGLIEPNPDHLAAMGQMALAMHEHVRGLHDEFPGLSLRIGVHVGSVIAGVIGIRKFIYDVWGDTVNTASRLEHHGTPWRVHVSDVVHQRLQGRFAFEPCGRTELKGRGAMDTWFLGGAIPVKQLSDCRLLLVDDAKANLDILVEGLKGEHKLSLALNGETALQIAQRLPPDLVLLDIVMPGLDGYEVCRRLRAMPETAEVPIIFLSSLEDVQNKSRGFEAGANDYVTKPFNLLEVKARVRALLKAKAYSDAVKEQLAADLRVARDIQMGMIPHDFAALERDFGVDLAGVLEPAREVGGDLYGAFASAAGRLVLFAGDVSGKGIPASLFMVRAASLARLLGRDDTEPERILAKLNDELSTDNPSGMFVTMICAVYDPITGRIAMANAGHSRPLLLSYGTGPRWAVDRLGTALGFEPGLRFERTELVLQPGDALVFYTDGVNEAFNPEGQCYGNERLLHEAAELAAQPAEAVCEGLLGQVRVFAAGAPQSDDIAILVLRPGDRPAVLAPRLGTLCMDLPATPEDVMRAVTQLQAFGREHGVDERTLFGLAVALEECAANIVHHACEAPGEHQFQVRFERNAEGLELELIDRGPAFDPTTAAVPDVGIGEELSPSGGWGIHLARHYSDEITYRRDGDENILRLSKRLVPRRA